MCVYLLIIIYYHYYYYNSSIIDIEHTPYYIALLSTLAKELSAATRIMQSASKELSTLVAVRV